MKAEKERIEKHKRQVEELKKDLLQDMEEKNRETRQLVRKLRLELHLKEKELRVARQEEGQLQEQVVKEQRQTERVRKVGETWQASHKDLVDAELGNGERVVELEREVKGKTWEMSVCRAKHAGYEMQRAGGKDKRPAPRADLHAQVSHAFLFVFFVC